jgi:DNA-directed RNA polymerase subunit RPC12/RpoP
VERKLIDPKSYVEQGCPYIAFTDTALHGPMGYVYGKVISDFTMYVDPSRGEVKKIKVECPHCNSIIEYRGIYWGGTGISFTGGRTYRIACRNCNQRMDLK